MAYLSVGFLFVFTSIVPAMAWAQQPSSRQKEAALRPSVRPVAPPAVHDVPSGSASMSPSQRRTMEAVRLADDERITLDGRLDEDVWMRAVPATNFVQTDPDNGQPATEQTEVRIVYNADYLYMGVTLFDSEPDKLIYYQMGRDGFLPSDDKLQWAIDTFNDGRTAYWWEMNPAGSMADALRGANNTSNRQWDGIWDARATRSEIGWTLEIEVPFRTMNFNPDSEAWGINFQRTIARKNEVSLWMGWPRNQGLNRMSNAGLLTGIRDVSQGYGLDAKPYVVGTSESFPGRGDAGTTNDANVGVDFFYSLTPQLRANVTFNTDFAQAEVDARQVNLTRFSLLFPEKRDFFLDGALFFDFGTGGTGGDLIPFFSRRIGLDAAGTPQRINFGNKLTGQAGAYDIGVLQVQTGKEDNVLGEDFAVMRVKRRMLRESYTGALYTLRHARGGDLSTHHTIGVDFRLATSGFRGSENLSAAGYLLHTTNPRDTGKSSAFGAELAYPNDPLDAQIGYTEVQEHYDAAVGFTRRTGFRHINPRVTFAPRPRQHRWIRRFNFGGNLGWFLDSRDNRLLTREIDVTAFQVDLHRQDSIQFHVVPTYERLLENFRIAPGVTLPAGQEYRFTRYRVQGSTTSRRPLALSPQVEWGSFFSGDLLQLGLTANLRVAPGQMFTFTNEWNRVSLAEGEFYTRLYRVIAETQFNPRVALVNNVQYDSQSTVIGWQSRFRWIVTPGSDLYFVYIHNWLDDPVANRTYTLDRRLASKVLYTHRF
ncbi:MAG: carbohydrate binding family 9 domain-containing protein [Acidobacteria bacterium]|nr:carbohydrate binding family 9 domain-containing protein [Acidobacteriota bacterium]